ELTRRAVDRWFGHGERARRRRERTVLGDGEEGPHLRSAEFAFDGAKIGGTAARNTDAKLGQCLVKLCGKPRSAALQNPAGLRQVATGVAPVEQRRFHLLLEPGDSLGDCRL